MFACSSRAAEMMLLLEYVDLRASRLVIQLCLAQRLEPQFLSVEVGS